MKRFAPALASIFLPVVAHAAVLTRAEIPAAIALPASQYAQVPNVPTNLSPLERQVIEEMNRARTNPRAYANWLAGLKQYYNGTVLQLPNEQPIDTQEGIRAVDDAIRFLLSQQSLPPLRLSPGMSMGSADHINDIGAKGTLGHYGSDGSQFLDRISLYGTSTGATGENISYGVTTAQAIVMQWIVDDGIQGRHHRNNVFYDGFNRAGIACGQHRRYGQMCVATYSGEYSDRVATVPPPAATINPSRITANNSLPQPSELVAPPPSNPTVEITPQPLPPLTPSVPAVEVRIPSPSSSPVVINPQTSPPVLPPSNPTVEVAPRPLSPSTPSQVRIPPPSSSPVVINPQPSPPVVPPSNPTVEVAPQPSPPLTPSVPAVEAGNPLPSDPPPAEVENTNPPEVATAPPANAAAKIILKEQGSLENGDAVYERDGSLYDVHIFEGRAGQSLLITAESQEFDTFLAVFDEGDEIVGQNDDIREGETNSSLTITLPRNGTYRIFINGYDAEERGRYTVTAVEQPNSDQ